LSFSVLNRFQRDYELIIRSGARQLTIKPPFRIQFDATKSTNGVGLNKMTISIYGLGRNKREFVTKDAEEKKLVSCEFKVGYQGSIERLFTGQLNKGFNKLSDDGFVTTIEVFDGGYDYLNSYTSKTVSGKVNAINTILLDMPNTALGKVSLPTELIRPKVLVGSSSKLLEELAGSDQELFIDDGRINLINKNEVVSTFIPIVSAETGLLNTPQREFQKITFDTLMNPSIKIAGRVSLKSITAPQYDGVYRIDSIIYSGDLEGNEWKQSVTGFLANNVSVI